MEFQFEDVKQGFTSPDFLFNFEPGGQIAPKYNAPPAPNSIENLTFEYIQKQQQLSDAVQQQHRIDNIYERVMNEAPRRDVEVLPPEDPANVFNKTRLKNITPVEQQQEISELLERQVKRPTPPSPATPPVTSNPKTYPLTDPLAPPPTFTPRSPVNGPNPSPLRKPPGLPTTSGRFTGPLVGGAIDLGFRLIAGQPPGKALFGALGSTAGSVVGGVLGSAFGPVGTFVGGVIGGFVGGAIADFISDAVTPSPATPNFEPYKYPAQGKDFVRYEVRIRIQTTSKEDYIRPTYICGPFELVFTPYKIGVYGYLISNDGASCSTNQGENLVTSSSSPIFTDAQIVSVSRIDGLPDVDPNPSLFPPFDNRTPASQYYPGDANNSPPSGYPSAGKIPPKNDYAPSGFTAGGTQRGDAPDWIPSGFPAPKQNPNPNTTPNNLGGDFPGTSPSLAPSPSSPGAPSPTPSPNPPGYRLDGPNYKPSGSPSGSPGTIAPPQSTPNGLPQPTPQTPPVDGFKPVPQPDPQPQPQTQPTPPETDICQSPCIQSMGQKITQSSIFWVEVQVPTVICELKDNTWTPKENIKTVQVLATPTGSEVLKTQTEFNELAKANSELCLAKNKEFEAYLSVPDYWQTRSPQKPQLAIQYAENLGNGKVGRSRWTLLLPHYRYGEAHKPNFTDYEKGNYRGIQVLSDNSKIIVWCKNETECLRVINALKQYVEPDFLKGIKPTETTNSHKDYKEVPVTPTLCQFFPTGQKDAVPSWSKKLRDKK